MKPSSSQQQLITFLKPTEQNTYTKSLDTQNSNMIYKHILDTTREYHTKVY